MHDRNRFMSVRRLALSLICVAALAPGLATAGEKGGATGVSLKKVEAKKVCMVNNQVFEKDQIPIHVDGRTYYGCCEMCKERLAKDPSARTAKDPVTGKQVDKATALIAALPDGSVLYFADQASFERYASEKKE